MVIFTGASVEEAIQNGLKTLDIPRRASCMISLSPSYHLKEGIHIVQ